MKVLLVLAITSTFTLAEITHAGHRVNVANYALSALAWGPAALSHIYAPLLSAGALNAAGSAALLGTSLVYTVNDRMGKEIKNLINNDAQEFYANGRLSVELAMVIDLIKRENPNLTDIEAVDEIVSDVNLFF